MGYRCSRCGEWHDELPYAFHVAAPAVWSPELEDDGDSWLEEELCVVGGEHFFIRGLIKIPVVDAEHDFEWGVWTSLSRDNFARTLEIWEREGRETEPPMRRRATRGNHARARAGGRRASPAQSVRPA